MLLAMWVFPLVAAAVAGMFAALLGGSSLQRRRSYQLFWAIAMLMYAVASLAVAIGALDGWSRLEFEMYWVFGAVLNVPFLAAGEIALLIAKPWVTPALWLILVFVCRVRGRDDAYGACSTPRRWRRTSRRARRSSAPAPPHIGCHS